MSTIKKLLALTLALAMVLSVSAFAGFSGSSYKDAASINGDCEDAIELLYALDIMTGDDKGNFNPEATITRAEVAKMIYVILNYGDDDKAVNYTGANIFSDVVKGAWYEGYVNYMAMTKLVQGRPDGTFGPNDPITTAEAAKMLLTAIGYSAEARGYTGAGWDKNVLSDAAIIGLLDGYKANTTSYAPRQWVAVMFKNALTGAYTYGTIAPVIFNGLLTGATLPTYKEEYLTMGQKYFGLEYVSGVIEAVDYLNGTTTIGNIVVENTEADFRDIGYLAGVWTVDTAKAKTNTALEDVAILGESLYESNDGTSYHAIVNVYEEVAVDTDFDVYFNGVKVTGNDRVAALDKISNVGVKVDFVDNDFGGKAEAVIVTEYTVADVTGIAKDTTTGYQAVKEDRYYFNYGTAVRASRLVTDDELEVGDLVVYVYYNLCYYTDEAELTVADFDKINYKSVGGADKSYVFDEVTYLKSAKAIDTTDLVAANLNETFDLYTDPYGHLLVAELTTYAKNYFYVLANDHTVGTTGLTSVKVIDVDGNVDVINVSGVYRNGDKIRTTWMPNTIENCIFAYTENDDGSYKLYESDAICMIDTGYTSGRANWGTAGVNLETKIIDIRNSTVMGTIYTGYAEIPSMASNADVCYLADDEGYITVGFLKGGDKAADKSAEFIVFKTSANYAQKTSSTTYYYLDVMVDGALVEDYKLSATQYAEIAKYGVGIYEFGEDGKLVEYTSFDEEGVLTRVVWYAGSIKANGAYYTYDEAKFNALDIDNASANDFSMVYGEDYNAYLVYNSKGTQVLEIYIVVDVDNDTLNGVAATQVKDGSVYTYSVEAYDITKVVSKVGPADCVVTINDVPFWTVKAGDVITVPTASEGTGVKVTVGETVSYAAYGAELTITANTAIETGYVAWTEDGVVYPVEFAEEAVALNSELTLDGTYVKWTKSTGATGIKAVTDSLWADADTTFVDGYYKVTVEKAGVTVTLNGEVQAEAEFYVTAADRVVVSEAGQADVTYGAEGSPIAGDITIA